MDLLVPAFCDKLLAKLVVWILRGEKKSWNSIGYFRRKSCWRVLHCRLWRISANTPSKAPPSIFCSVVIGHAALAGFCYNEMHLSPPEAGAVQFFSEIEWSNRGDFKKKTVFFGNFSQMVDPPPTPPFGISKTIYRFFGSRSRSRSLGGKRNHKQVLSSKWITSLIVKLLL